MACNSNEIEKRALREDEAAIYIGLSPSFLRQSRSQGIRKNHVPPPPFVRLGRVIRYLKEDLDHWLENQRAVQNCSGLTKKDQTRKTKCI